MPLATFFSSLASFVNDVGQSLATSSAVLCQTPNSEGGIDTILRTLFEKQPPKSASEQFAEQVLPTTDENGARSHSEQWDPQGHKAYAYPWPADRVPYHAHGNKKGSVPREGYKGSPVFESNWELQLAYHHGLYDPEALVPPKQTSVIERDVDTLAQRLFRDNPRDVCAYLLLEEHRCLEQHHLRLAPQNAAQSCLKWFAEWSQCQWDQEKYKQGYNYIELRPERKHRPFYSTPAFRYA